MKKIYRSIIIALSLISTVSCLEDVYPSSGVIAEQLVGDVSAVAGQVNSIPGAMFRYGSAYTSCGYPGIMILRDAMIADMPVFDLTYDYYGWYVGTETSRLGDYDMEADNWLLYVKLIHKCNSVLQMCPKNLAESDATLASYRGFALAFRAFAYLDMARMYEYKKCGVAKLDSEAETNGAYGLTVPIVTENTTLIESYNNPRAEFWKMYRFILTDLNEAAEILPAVAPSKIFPSADAARGLLARMWLELGTRFRLHPEDLTEALAHEAETGYDKLGVATYADAYKKADENASAVVNAHPFLTEMEWMNPTTGFNTPVADWIWCMGIGSDDDAVHSWMSWIPELNPEVQYGVCYPLNAFRMIDAALYKKIGPDDWRRKTWIDPKDAKKATAYGNYQTNLSEEKWVKLPAYTGMKFRPAQGNIEDYTIGTAVSIPLMRSEEMALIKAEAMCFTEGVGSALNYLKSVISTRDASYSPSASTEEELVDEVFTQKRIELWGEGLLMFDYKRLEKRITRGYTGSNFESSHQINSLNKEGEVCRWLNFFITSSEYNFNKAVYDHRNPDPSGNASYEY